MDIKDFTPKDKKLQNKNHWLLPNQIRAILVGPSGCGKTNLLLNLILQPNWLEWHKVFIIAPTSGQSMYEKLREFSDEEEISFINDVNEAPDPDDLDENLCNCIVFDDCMLENQDSSAKLFSRGRHKGADTFYLLQKYTHVPKVIRDNANLFFLFHGIDGDALRKIHQVWCASDMNFEEFKDFFRQSTQNMFDFAVIDLTERPFSGKYRKSFENFYIPTVYVKNIFRNI